MSDTKVRVLRAFGYSGDGFGIRKLDEGDEVHVREDLLPGLLAEGFVRRPDAGSHIGAAAPVVDDVERAMIDAPENKAIEPPENKLQAPVTTAAIDAMGRQELVKFLGDRGVQYFRGASDEVLRVTAKDAAGVLAR